MKLVIQPTDATCGQSCLSMLFNTSVYSICKLIDNYGYTTTKNIKVAITKLNYVCGEHRIRINKNTELPKICLLFKKYDYSPTGHWCLFINNKVYDPSGAIYKFSKNRTGRFTSYLEIK